MMKDAYWSEFLWSIRIFTPPSREVFIEKAKKRVFDMIHPLYGRPSIVEEINLFFNCYQTVNPLKDIDGYREIIDYYEKNSILPDGKYNLSHSEEEMIIKIISDKYYEHALWQESEFKGIPASWSWELLEY